MTEKKRILICTDLYPLGESLTARTDTFAVRELVEGLSHTENVSIEVVNIRPGFTRKGISVPFKTMVNGIPVYHVPRVGVRDIFSAAATRRILSLLGLLIDFDLMVCHMARQFVWASRIFPELMERSIYVLHGSDLASLYLHPALQQSSKVLVRSPALDRRLQTVRGFFSDGVAFSGVAAHWFSETAGIKKSTSTLKLVVASKLIPLKNLGPIIDLVARLSTRLKVHLDIFGDGPLRPLLEERIENNHVADIVALHGFCSKARLKEAFNAAHLFVMPSAPETLGLAYLEAMACGCVAIGHAGWGIDGIVEDGVSGYLVQEATVEELMKKVSHYLEEGKFFMHENAYRCVRSYDMDSAIKNYSSLILL